MLLREQKYIFVCVLLWLWCVNNQSSTNKVICIAASKSFCDHLQAPLPTLLSPFFTKSLWELPFKFLSGWFLVTSTSLEAQWHACNKELIAALLPKHRDGSRGPRAHVMALTGPEDSTVTVREPAGWLDAVVKRRGEETETAANTWAYFDARVLFRRSFICKQTARIGAWLRAGHNGGLAVMWQEHAHIKHTRARELNLVSPSGAPDSSALSFQSVSGSSKHPVQLLFLADCTCTT